MDGIVENPLFKRTNLHKLFADCTVVGAPYAQGLLNINEGGNLQVLKANKDLQGYIKLLNNKYPGKF